MKKHTLKTQTALALGAGLVAAASPAAQVQPELAPPGRVARGVPMGNIYYNVRTGERVVTPFVPGARDGSLPLWLNNNSDPCATGMTVGILDDPDTDGDGCPDGPLEFCCSSPTGCNWPFEGSWNVFWGDIAHDTVVDCVRIAYGIEAPDTDTNNDGVGDGIVGYDMFIQFSDADDGFDSQTRRCITEITIPTLPGALPGLPPGYMTVYYVTLDFAASAPSQVFELGDSDTIDDAGTGLSGGAIYGSPTYLDIDGDTLGDFSFAIRFDQSSLPVPGEGPGRTKGASGFVTVAAKLGNPGDTPPHPADATGLFDALDVYTTGPSCPPSSVTEYIGTFFFGGFSCDFGTPYASAWLELYGPNGLACGRADTAPPFGSLDYSDVIAFLVSFADCGPAADLFPPFGACDFQDVIAFLTAFGEGCP